MIDLRGAPVIAVSTATLLGRSTSEEMRDVCIIVEFEPGLRLALFVDRALGLERVSPAVIYTMPETMAGVESYFVLNDDDGDEIVGIISPRALIAQIEPALRECIPRAAPEMHALAFALSANAYFRSTP